MIHTHIQRRLLLIGKAPLRVIQLIGADPQIQQYAVDPGDPLCLQKRLHFKEIPVESGKSFSEGSKPQ